MRPWTTLCALRFSTNVEGYIKKGHVINPCIIKLHHESSPTSSPRIDAHSYGASIVLHNCFVPEIPGHHTRYSDPCLRDRGDVSCC